jgi:DNA-binding winged helix-turn-helix (wHTH) protein/tetratricopeptide (TPR) repeat protein
MDVSLRKTGVYAFGRFRLDGVRRILTRDSTAIALTPRLFDTLLYLVENPGRVIEKDEIMTAVWPGRFVEEGNISQTIFTVRKALSLAGEEDRLIETVPGHGYRFTADVQLESESPASNVAIERDPSADGSAEPVGTLAGHLPPRDVSATRAKWLASACAVFVLFAAGYATFKWSRRDLDPAAQSNIVVLADVQNLTGDPAFVAVLDKVLEIDIAQSPFLSLLPSQRVRETLQLMERPGNATLTPELAQEVCARNEGRAVLSGAVAAMGSRYIVTLQATDCISGNAIAESKTEVGRKDDVPDALDGLSARMREALNESLASIRKFDVPIAQATTSSFEALTDFSLGERSRANGDYTTSIPLFRRAIELDPSFALAYEDLGADYAGLREPELVRASYQKAFLLSARVGENEKLRISANYYQRAGNFADAIRTYQLWTQTYPRDWLPWSNLAGFYLASARYEDAVEAGKQALRLNPENNAPYTLLARAYKRLTRFAEAKAICRQAIAKGLDGWDIHGLLYEIAFAERDTATMAEQVAREKGKPTEGEMLDYEALGAATDGQLRRSRALLEQAMDVADQQGPDARGEVTAFLADIIDMDSLLGAHEAARNVALKATGQDQTALTLAEVGDISGATALIAALKNAHPDETELVDFYLPLAQAEIDLGQHQPQDAIAALQPAGSADLRDFWAPSLRGQAWLDTRSPNQAAADFRQILANRGVDGLSPQYPLAYLGLARALHMEGKLGESRAAYQQLFAFWKNADADLPVLQVARREYGELTAAQSASARR